MISSLRGRALAYLEGLPWSAREHAVASSLLSLGVGVFEGLSSWILSKKEGSDSLMGVVGLGSVEVATSGLILYRWKVLGHGTGQEAFDANESRFEVMGSVALSILMISMGLWLMMESVVDLMLRKEQEEVFLGVVCSAITAVASLLVAEYQIYYGKKLGSMILISDGKCTQCSGLAAAVVVVGLLARRVFWWADSVVGVFVSTYIAIEGAICYSEARVEWRRAQLEGWGSSRTPLTLEQRLLGPQGLLPDRR